jgi:hypothetical protein
MALDDQAIQAKLDIEQHVERGQEGTFSILRDKLHLFDAETGAQRRA